MPPDAARATDEVEGHASTALTMSDGTSPLSWSCATGAAAAAEAWVTTPPPQPPEQHAAPPSGYSAAAWRASGAAAHFLANLIAASTVGGETEGSAAATRAGRRALGLDAAPSAVGKEIASDTVGALEPEDGLAAAALDALGSGSNDGTDAELAGRSAFGVALHGALRLAAVVPGAPSEPLAARLAGRVVRQLTIAAGVAAAANALDDGVIRGGRAPFVSAAELPAQRALVVALEMLESGAEAGTRRRRTPTPRAPSPPSKPPPPSPARYRRARAERRETPSPRGSCRAERSDHSCARHPPPYLPRRRVRMSSRSVASAPAKNSARRRSGIRHSAWRIRGRSSRR